MRCYHTEMHHIEVGPQGRTLVAMTVLVIFWRLCGMIRRWSRS